MRERERSKQREREREREREKVDEECFPCESPSHTSGIH